MANSYAPRSPDLSGYAPRSPDLGSYQPQSPGLKHDPYAPQSPDLSGVQPYSAQQQIPALPSGFNLHDQVPQQQQQWDQHLYPQQQQQLQQQQQQQQQFPYLAQGGPPQFAYAQQPPQLDQWAQDPYAQQQPYIPQFGDPHTAGGMPSQTRSSRNGNPSYAEDPASDSADYMPDAAAAPTTPARRGRRPKSENNGSGLAMSSIPAMQKMDTGGIEVKTKFPTARIKRIMQADEDVGKVAQVTPVVVAKALELFMIRLITSSASAAKARGSKRVLSQHMKAAVMQDDQFDNLRDIVSKVPDAPVKGGNAAADDNDDDEDGTAAAPKKGGRRKGGAEAKTPAKGKRRRDSAD